MSLMGLDIGTSGSKCTLFDEEGHVLATAYRDYSINHPQTGYYELDPLLVWRAVTEVIQQVTRDSRGDWVQAIAISSFGEAAVPLGPKGEILGKSILYMDPRGNEQSANLAERLGADAVMTLTGLPIHPMYTINKLMWLRENQPDLYNRTWKFMLFGDFVIYQLTGLPVIDSSLASRTMAMNVIDKRWEPTILEAAGIDPALLSNLASSGTVVGTVTGSIAASLGLDARTAVVTGGHDQACAALGAGIVLEGFAMDGIGTVECITPAFSRPIINERMFRHNFNCAPHVVHGMYLAYAFNFTGGSLLQWYKNSFGQAATSEAERRGISAYDVLNETAAASPTDLLVVPHFSGSGTPYMNPTSRGAIYGLTLETRPDQIYRALLEGINYEMMVNLECLNDAGVRVNTLRAVGGGAQSALWMQIKANIFGRKVETLHVGEAGTLGAAILAGTAIGIYSSYEAAASQLIRIKDEFFPDSRQTAIYREKYEQYKTFSSKLISQ